VAGTVPARLVLLAAALSAGDGGGGVSDWPMVRIRLDHRGKGTIEVDGVSVPRVVAIRFEASARRADRLQRVTLEMLAEIDFEGPAEVVKV
jgi:hypothetical protein